MEQKKAPSKEKTAPSKFFESGKEILRTNRLDTLIVFGQGPVKPVLLERELTDQQRAQWGKFRANPLPQREPDFRVIEGIHQEQISEIEGREDLSEEEKQKLVEEKRVAFQHMGRFALNRWGRQNSLAAGVALLSGGTESVILSGGKTIPAWAKNTLPAQRLAAWPSEATLMKDTIVRTFGNEYQKTFGKPIEQAIQVEDASTNTLENFAFTLNNHPELLDQDKQIGLLATDFHIRRVTQLAHLFTLSEAAQGQLSAQSVLKGRAKGRSEVYGRILSYMTSHLQNEDLRDRLLGEERWERGLIDPEFLTYWLGYIGDVEDPKVVRYVLDNISDPSWVNSARSAFKKIGLDFEDYKDSDVTTLKALQPEKYAHLMDGLRNLKSSKHRLMPPPVV